MNIILRREVFIKMKKVTVIFDMDGTILDTLEDLYLCVNETLRHFGYPEKTKDEIRQFVGNGVYNLIRLALPDGEANPDFEKVLEYNKELYAKHANDHTKPYDGIIDLMAWLKENGHPMAIVSNKVDAQVKDLRDIYFKDYIQVAIGEDEAHGVKKKPAPDTVFKALKELGIEPENAVYVGDSEVDVATARNSGLRCLSVQWGFRDSQTLIEAGATELFNSPEELKNVLS